MYKVIDACRCVTASRWIADAFAVLCGGRVEEVW
jgi:hypothetical protein